MGRIRLQICVLPWELPGSSFSGIAPAREEVKWCEPCTEDTPMQCVCDKIYRSWERMFKQTMGPLKIRHLKTAYGDFLDLQERVVGDFFDDRGADGNIRNSILEVHRYPPTPDQLEVIQRFSSLAPTSSVRPRKRPLELPSQTYASQISRSIHREIPSIEEGDAEATTSFGIGTKRQRTHESRLNRAFGGYSELRMREEQGGGPFHSSQTSGTEGSIHQVLDSQKSPGKKHPNPYGTPTSLALVGLQESVPSSEIDLSAIPDSPVGRVSISAGGTFAGATQLDRESTKSESPELRASVHEVPRAGSTNPSGEQPVTSPILSDSLAITGVSESAPQSVPIAQNVDEYVKDPGLDVGKTSEKVAQVNRDPKPGFVDSARAQNVQSFNNILHDSDPIFDPIESDTESFREKQQMQSAKRLRSSKTPSASLNSFRASNTEEVVRRDGQFVVPSLPQSRRNRTRTLLCETTSSGQRENIPLLRRDPKDANKSVQNDTDRHNETPEDPQSGACNKDRVSQARETPEKDTVCNGLIDAARTSSQVTIGWSQDSSNPADGTAVSNIEQRQDKVSSQNKKADEITHLGLGVDDIVGHPDDSRSAPEVEGPGGEVEDEQARTGMEKKEFERTTSAQETMKKVNPDMTKAAERKVEDGKLASKKIAKEKARAKEAGQAKKAKAKEQEPLEGKRIEEMRANEARLSEEKKISEKLARERIREASLREKADRVMLTADGAKQIEAEKMDKEKARREELTAKKQANKTKADEQAREGHVKDREKKVHQEQCARKRAQKLANSECKEAEEEILPARTTRETATAVREQAQRRIADREAQKLRNSSELLSRASSNPLISADPTRSMTPRIPGSSITPSSPLMNSFRSDSRSNKSPGNMNAPLRSALRQTSSALGRSVSSVSFDIPQQGNLNEHITSTPTPKLMKQNNNNVTTRPSSARTCAISPPRTISNPPLKTPIKIVVPKKKSGGKNEKIPAKNGKVQTKLNVTREPKKMKGRAVPPPTKAMQVPKQEIVISSGEDSSSSEETTWQTGNAEAGPSSRKLAVPAVSQQKKTVEVQSSGTPIDPSIRNIKVEKDRTAAPTALPRRTSTLHTASLQTSTSRSPALVVSETISLSSGSPSTTAGESELESDPEEQPQVPSSTGTKSGIPASAAIKGVIKAVDVVAKQPQARLNSETTSQSSSQASSSGSSRITLVEGDGKHIDHAADKQLLLESQHSTLSSRVDMSISTTNGDVGDKIINQGLDHAGRLPNGIRPSYYKYPSLSELQKVPPAGISKAEPRRDTFSSQPLGASPVCTSGSDSSSSECDDRSSNTDRDDIGGPLIRATAWKPFPGMKGLTKLAKKVRPT